ncbi:hypothetical protein JYU34_004626 [Plutella xylostella]|uniref:Uncharacterized protein n=1 Tax=Plutella xylostella TaxID=51655 RepID=A0ABQ7QYG5_PLUXY|nr:hypothetical protein JYU34_004626 [Plutella xylostella]
MMSGVVSKYCIDNMICLEDGDPSVGEFKLAGLLASHLVGQVLDEAYIIANAAKESGQPWRYWKMVKNLRNDKLTEPDLLEHKKDYFAPSSTLTMDDNVEGQVNSLVTSTPQKHDDVTKHEVTLIGQGDGDARQTNFSDKSCTFSNLENMSDICDNNEYIETLQIIKPPVNTSEQILHEIIDSGLNENLTFSMAAARDDLNPFRQMTEMTDKDKISEEYSENSLWTGMFGIDPNDLAFGVELDENVNSYLPKKESTVVITHEQSAVTIMNQSVEAYLTLNRDYEIYSDEDGDPILQDPKSLVDLQEIDLLTADVSEKSLAVGSQSSPLQDSKQKQDELSSASGMTSSSKKSLSQRCRVHGARLMQCLRGWWKRRTPGTKESDRPGVGCLTPGARRRGRSLDQRGLGDQVTSLAPWRPHTLSGALRNTTCWRQYTFETNPHCRNN